MPPHKTDASDADPVQAFAEGTCSPSSSWRIVGLCLGVMRDSRDERLLRDMGDRLRSIVESALELVFLVVRGVLQYAPVGVALIAVTLGEVGVAALVPLAKLTGTVYGGIALQAAAFWPAPRCRWRLLPRACPGTGQSPAWRHSPGAAFKSCTGREPRGPSASRDVPRAPTRSG